MRWTEYFMIIVIIIISIVIIIIITSLSLNLYEYREHNGYETLIHPVFQSNL